MTATRTEHAVPDSKTISRRGRRLAIVLVFWQIAVTVAGSVAAFYPAMSPTCFRVLIVVEVALTVGMIAVGFEGGALRPASSLLACYGLSMFIIVLGIRLLLSRASLEVYVDNTLRLGLPLCVTLAMTKAPELVGDSIRWIKRYALATDLCACVALIAIGMARHQGWGGAWITDPFVPVVVFPLIFREKGVSVPRILLYGLVVGLSGKRWLLLVWIVAIAVGAFMQHRRRMASIVFTAISVVAVGYLLTTVGYLSRIEDRGTNALNFYRSGAVRTATSVTAADASIGQRMEEIGAELTALRDTPGFVIFGRDLDEIELKSGTITHAIHCTPVFLLARGGLIWLVAMFCVGGRNRTKNPRSFSLAIAITLLSSFSSNMALDPGVLLSMSALAQRRSTSTAS